MLKRLLPFCVALLVAVFTTQAVHAQTLSIDSIGNTNTEGETFTSWTHIGANPAIKGSASPSAQVRLQIENTTYTTFANTIGDWQYQPTTLSSLGAYSIQVSSLAETILFTLNITASATSSASPSPVATQPALPETLPDSGSSTLFTVLGIGLLMVAVGISARMALSKNSV
ncbi:MAG: hypothetical protein WAU07_04810 [Microgenomates group bacterium]